jgi:hypothetical protein
MPTSAVTNNLPPWLEGYVAEGLKLVKQLHDTLPPVWGPYTGVTI